MELYRIVVAESSETYRNQVCKLLNQRGYKTYHATDSAGAIRISRSIYPDIVIMDVNLWGMKAYEAARIIEEDKLSTVIFIISNPTDTFYQKLRNMNVFAYIMKPMHADQLYRTVEFSIMNAQKIKSLSNKIEKLENTLENRKKVDKAKGLLMENLKFSENEAYKWLRKKSMNTCISIDKMAEKIIEKYR
ncbi:ANTAR domain-containing response regulator [Marinisporobacter balticus]|uniref:Stage 0 sporulation protein A homolog n=1 Tax=Marinisporobacter balticus TaxID=2018667 RepID=A0A4R2KAL8_9FIRM|nr:ANTAR domain-containing protein [Marinisporobacter balticus]TCO69057.1 response regulator receiver and ANTAR domain protein [Marinisporobacter balticus]